MPGQDSGASYPEVRGGGNGLMQHGLGFQHPNCRQREILHLCILKAFHAKCSLKLSGIPASRVLLSLQSRKRTRHIRLRR